MEWAVLFIVAGFLVWYAVSEKKWGCLTAIVAAVSAFLAWGVSAGLFNDWGGPLRGAWKALTGWF